MFLSIFVVMISILSFICESHYWFQVYSNDSTTRAEDPEQYYPAASKQVCCHDAVEREYPETRTVKYLTYIEWSCLLYFILELVIRFIFAPEKCAFVKSLLNIIDIICIVPQMISILLEYLEPTLGSDAGKAGDILQITNILRTVRVLRIFKLMKHYSAFKVLAYTIKVRNILNLILSICCFLFIDFFGIILFADFN